jgi:ferredoxin, 2Fe-2S
MDTYKIKITDRNGTQHELEGLEGWRVMEVIRDAGLPIKAECGGCCACATCHVYVKPEWFDKLVPPTQEEINMMDEAFDVKDNSRLSCQILLRPEFNGLEVTLAPDGE